MTRFTLLPRVIIFENHQFSVIDLEDDFIELRRTGEQCFFNNLENVYFIPCELMLDPDHCQSIQNGLFLSDMMDHRLFRILYKLINQVHLELL